MQTILSKQLREKAGSDSYNRYEYQVGWTMHHMLRKYKNNESFLVFCEYHDDMSEVNNIIDQKQMNFYQVKTKEKGNFTFNVLFSKNKKKSHSFMGYLFYNFYHFNDDCSKCYFIGNRPFDDEVKSWQSVVKDDKDLSKENKILYDKIYSSLSSEFTDDKGKLPGDFQKVFDKFIQNTFITTSEIPLENHSKFLQAEFFNALKFKALQMNTAHLIFDTILNEVRTKTKTIIQTPISFTELKEKKGIQSNIFEQIEYFQSKEQVLEPRDEIKTFLLREGVPLQRVKLLLRELNDHYNLFIDISNTQYIDLVKKYKGLVLQEIRENDDIIDKFDLLKSLINDLISKFLLENSNPFLNKIKLEVLFYESFLSE